MLLGALVPIRSCEMRTMTATSVLVVDDEPQVAWMLAFSLEAEGYTTLTARDGRAALDEVRRHHPAVMLLDIMMPVMDGWTVLEELRAFPEHERPKVIVVSARASLRDRAMAAELGADAFVAKPFDVDELLALVRGFERVPG
jgi:two-component system KDP operon response regulator KdpE